MSSAAVQTSVAIHPDLGLPGMEYDSGTPKTVITRIAAETIKFGAYAYYTGETCGLGTTGSHLTSNEGGVALRDPTNPKGEYRAGDPVALMVDGFVWVPTEEAVGATDTVFVRVAGATGATEANGLFRNDTDGGNAVNPPGIVWHKGGTSVAVLRLGVAGAAGGATGPTS